MKTAIVYYSRHHGNTKKLLDAIAQCGGVTLIDAAAPGEARLDAYDLIGFASGVYYGTFHESVLKFAREHLPENKRVFFLCTYGGKRNTKAIAEAAAAKGAAVVGEFGCKAFDTFGPFRLIGGINKGHPDARDLEDARRFYQELCQTLSP